MSGNSNRELCVNQREWNGKDDGREFQRRGNICIPVADSCFYRKQQNSVRQYSSIKKQDLILKKNVFQYQNVSWKAMQNCNYFCTNEIAKGLTDMTHHSENQKASSVVLLKNMNFRVKQTNTKSWHCHAKCLKPKQIILSQFLLSVI